MWFWLFRSNSNICDKSIFFLLLPSEYGWKYKKKCPGCELHSYDIRRLFLFTVNGPQELYLNSAYLLVSIATYSRILGEDNFRIIVRRTKIFNACNTRWFTKGQNSIQAVIMSICKQNLLPLKYTYNMKTNMLTKSLVCLKCQRKWLEFEIE